MFKSWWSSEQERDAALATDTRLDALEQSTDDFEVALDSLSEGTRSRLDSVRAWVEGRAREISTESDAGRLDMARQAWQDARGRLPADLSAYERKVALKEAKTTIVTWFKLSDEDWKSITSDG